MVARVALLGIGLLAFLFAATWAAGGWQRVEAPGVTAAPSTTPPSDVTAAAARPASSVMPPVPSTTVVQSPSVGPLAREELSVGRQQELVDQVQFEIEVLKDEVRQEVAFVEPHKYVALSGPRPMLGSTLEALRIEVGKSAHLITDPTLRARFQSDVVDALRAVIASRAAKNRSIPVLGASLQRQQDLVDQLDFEIEVLKEDIRQEEALHARHKYLALTGRVPDIDGAIQRVAGSVDKSGPQITDAMLRLQFKTHVVDALSELQQSWTAKSQIR